ncbi:MAG: hypothetical protein ACT4N8_06310 [Sphingosinicella sp.]
MLARRSKIGNPEAARRKLIDLLERLPERLESGTVGEQVGGLVEVNLCLRELGAGIGASLAPDDGDSGLARLLAYLRHQVGRIVHTEELMIVAGIGDYPRRIRELRTDHGWPIISGMAVRDMRAENPSRAAIAALHLSDMAPEEYLLIEDCRDADAVRRWSSAAAIKEKGEAPKDALASYLGLSPDRRITAEELRFVAGNKKQWPGLVRQLRDEGMEIRSRAFGHLELPPGIFVYSRSGSASGRNRPTA